MAIQIKKNKNANKAVHKLNEQSLNNKNRKSSYFFFFTSSSVNLKSHISDLNFTVILHSVNKIC